MIGIVYSDESEATSFLKAVNKKKTAIGKIPHSNLSRDFLYVLQSLAFNSLPRHSDGILYDSFIYTSTNSVMSYSVY